MSLTKKNNFINLNLVAWFALVFVWLVAFVCLPNRQLFLSLFFSFASLSFFAFVLFCFSTIYFCLFSVFAKNPGRATCNLFAQHCGNILILVCSANPFNSVQVYGGQNQPNPTINQNIHARIIPNLSLLLHLPI